MISIEAVSNGAKGRDVELRQVDHHGLGAYDEQYVCFWNHMDGASGVRSDTLWYHTPPAYG